MIYRKLFLYAHNGCFFKKNLKIHSSLLLGEIFLKANVRLGFKKAVYRGVWPHAVVLNKNSESSKLNSTNRFCGDIGMIFEEVGICISSVSFFSCWSCQRCLLPSYQLKANPEYNCDKRAEFKRFKSIASQLHWVTLNGNQCNLFSTDKVPFKIIQMSLKNITKLPQWWMLSLRNKGNVKPGRLQACCAVFQEPRARCDLQIVSAGLSLKISGPVPQLPKFRLCFSWGVSTYWTIPVFRKIPLLGCNE